MGKILTYIWLIGLISLIGFIIYVNVDFYKGKKNGTITKEDIEQLEEDIRIW